MQSILEMGYSKDIVLSAIETLRQKGKNEIFKILLLVNAAKRGGCMPLFICLSQDTVDYYHPLLLRPLGCRKPLPAIAIHLNQHIIFHNEIPRDRYIIL